MLFNKTVGIYNSVGSIDGNGEFVEGEPTFIKNIDLDIQPYSRQKLIQDYGFDIECTNRIFGDLDNNIEIDTYIKYDGLTFRVQKLIPWDDYLEGMVLQLE